MHLSSTRYVLQAQLWREIKTNPRNTQQLAVTRAETLKKTEEAGVAIKAIRGNRAQVPSGPRWGTKLWED